jgi:dCTP deaminase
LSETYFKEIARGLVTAEKSKLSLLKSYGLTKDLRAICDVLASYLDEKAESIDDYYDFSVFLANRLSISEKINLFLESSPPSSSWWALSLINDCYKICGIPSESRKILILHNPTINKGFAVVSDLCRNLPEDIEWPAETPIVDLFVLPAEASIDISSIPILGHEVGHVFLNLNLNKIEESLKIFLAQNEKKISSQEHLEEMFCDAIGSIIFAQAFDFAATKFLLTCSGHKTRATTHHPAPLTRMRNAICRLKNTNSVLPELKQALECIIDKCEESWDQVKAAEQDGSIKDSEFWLKILPEQIQTWLTATQTKFNQVNIENVWQKVIPELNAFRPPFETVSLEKPLVITPVEAIIGATIYLHGQTFKETNQFFLASTERDKENHLKQIILDHVKYVLSLYRFVANASVKVKTEEFKELSDKSLWALRADNDNPIVVVPTVDPIAQYGVNAIDLRLGTGFLINKSPRFTNIDPEKIKLDDKEAEKYLFHFFEKVEVPVGESFILHPHQFVLACTMEYITMPHNFYGLVLGRSTWGRLGLNIATATTVQAGYRGCLTLELRNLGETPLPLIVGLRIAQLCLITTPQKTVGGEYFAGENKYIGPVSAELPKFTKDRDWEVLEGM